MSLATVSNRSVSLSAAFSPGARKNVIIVREGILSALPYELRR
jgi:hypothetical protein